MQRRAAAVYVVFFLVVGAASYSLIATAEDPTIRFENPEHRLAQGDQFTVGDQTYNVTTISAEMESGGHGGGASLVRSGEVEWVNQSSLYTETWENNSTVSLQETQYRVLVPNESGSPSSFTLREEVNRTAILQQDPQADNATVTRDGEEFVVLEDESGNATLVPADEYFPEPSTRSFDEGATTNYNGNRTTFVNVTNSSVALEWTAPRTNTAELSDEGNVTLGGTTYLAYFPDNETAVLTTNFESYDRQSEDIHTYHERVNGLWGVSIVSFTVAILLIGMAYMPSRY